MNPFPARIFEDHLGYGCHPNGCPRFTDWYILDPPLFLGYFLYSGSKATHVLSTCLGFSLDAVPEGEIQLS